MSVDEYTEWVRWTPKPVERVRPRASYFVCGTPRCGSWLLCGLLASTGVAGRPHEWFWRDTRASLMRSWGAKDAAEYVELVLAAGTTANGVFGAKVMWGHLPELSPFPRPRFIWLRRRDPVAQAVSFAKAVQTGHWHEWDPAPRTPPAFRLHEVDHLLRELEGHNRRWAAWFADRGLAPLELAYDDLVADPEAQTCRVLGFLSLELPRGASTEPLTRGQRDLLNAEWCARYRAAAGG